MAMAALNSGETHYFLNATQALLELLNHASRVFLNPPAPHGKAWSEEGVKKPENCSQDRCGNKSGDWIEKNRQHEQAEKNKRFTYQQ